MKNIIFFFFVFLNAHGFSQSKEILSTEGLINKIEKERYIINQIDTVKKEVPCFGAAIDASKIIKNEYSYDTLYCKGILWYCSDVYEMSFYKIVEYTHEWSDFSDMSTLLYQKKKIKVINNYFYFTEEQFKEKSWQIKPEYIVKIFEEKNYKNE